MGRKGQAQKSRSAAVGRNHRIPSKDEKELFENVDKLLKITTLPHEPNVKKALENQREMNSIIDRIRILEKNKLKNKSESADKRTTAATIDNFIKWVTENGAHFKGCAISDFEGFELGLKVVDEIPNSSLVISVPRSLMLTPEVADKTELKDLMNKDTILKNMPNVALTMCLLFEKFKNDSFWKPYIDILPNSYNTTLYFSLDELEELRGSHTLESALKHIKSVGRQYAYFHKIFNISNDPVSQIMRGRFTYEEWCWAVSTVMTRQNNIPSDDGQRMLSALIPLWDLCNHTNGIITTDYRPESQQIECLALRDFKPGEQFFIFYGARTNAELFIHNGFVYEDNDHDTYPIRLGISKSDPLFQRRSELLEKLSISSSGDFFIRKGPEPIDGKLLAFSRVFNMNEDVLQHWLESDRPSDLEHPQCALDTDLERKSWTFLQTRLKLLLANFATTLEEDLKAMDENGVGTGSANKKLAVRMRATEKRILGDAAAYVDQHVRQ